MHSDEYTVVCERMKSQMGVNFFYWDNFIVLFVNYIFVLPKIWFFFRIGTCFNNRVPSFRVPTLQA